MNNLSKFINITHHCPICDNQLTLFAQINGGACFKGVRKDFESGMQVYKLTPFKKTDGIGQEEYITLVNHSDKRIEIFFSSAELASKVEENSLYFFYVCKLDGIRDKYNDYEIVATKACYYKSSPFYNVFGKDRKWNLENRSDVKLITHNELLSFKKFSHDLEKTYILANRFNTDEMMLYFYTTSPEERAMEHYRPKLFKSVKLAPKLLKFGIADREKLFDKFDSWIIMS